MTDPAGAPPADLLVAARLCAIDPRLGGFAVRGAGDLDGIVHAALVAAFPAGTVLRRLPVNVREDQLEGAPDLAGALGARALGLLERGGVLVVPMADRLAPRIAARLALALDGGGLVIAALIQEGGEVPPVLADRLALRIDLDRAAGEPGDGAAQDAAPAVTLATLAAALGVPSARADLLALRTARAAAALGARAIVCEADLALAARLVLAPRATRLPSPSEPETPSEAANERGADGTPGEGEGEGHALADRVLEAARAAIDPALLAALADGGRGRGEGSRAGGPGERRRGRERGRPVGTRAGDPRGGHRLALVETLRAAAPWQRLRGRSDRLLVRRSDLRVYRREARAETVAIFAVDASGSAAAARLAEAKGAIELLLGQAYVQRAEVALVAFRGTGAELLLPPTRSVTRARRALAELPGGGGTPLAAGLVAARGLARAVRAKGRTPLVLVLSDGRANIAGDGIAAGRAAATDDALAAARMLRHDGVAALFVDTGARPRPEGERLAAAMDARYLPLPHAGAGALTAAVAAFAPRRA